MNQYRSYIILKPQTKTIQKFVQDQDSGPRIMHSKAGIVVV